MTTGNRLTFLLATCIVLTCISLASCTKPEPPNQECDILSAWVTGAEWEADFYQTSHMRVENIPSNSNKIVFYVRSTSARRMPVHFELSQGATISPADGSLQDFSAGAVTYTVTSEDGAYSRRYTVTMRTLADPSTPSITTYSFEHVDSVGSSTNKPCYHTFYELEANGDTNRLWASGNEGVKLTLPYGMPQDFPTRSVNDGYSGKALCLTTLSAGYLGQIMNKPIAAGNLFIGEFDPAPIMTNPLRCTVFGTPVNHTPVTVSGYYKYPPGPSFTNASMTVDPDRTDEANIYGYFFRNEDANGNPVKLYGDNTETCPYVVRRAQVAALPPTTEWTHFEMTFEGDAVDAQALANYGYSMTIIFTSSKSGDTFEGAIGSTLLVDEVQITFEN